MREQPAVMEARNTKMDVIVVRVALGPSWRPGVGVAVKVEEAEEVLVVVQRDWTKLFGGAGDGGGEMCWRWWFW